MNFEVWTYEKQLGLEMQGDVTKIFALLKSAVVGVGRGPKGSLERLGGSDGRVKTQHSLG